MRIVLGNHLEALILLLQNQLRSHSLARSGIFHRDCGRIAVLHGDGRDSGICTSCRDAATHENCQFRRDVVQKDFLIGLHEYSL